MLWQHLGRISGPIYCHRWYFCQQQWAHARILGAFQRKQQGHSGSSVELLVAMMGPSQGISSISQEKQLASLSPSADSFSSNNRPMQVLWQHLRSSSEPIHCHWWYFFFGSNNGLMQGYQEHLRETAGPFSATGRIFGSNDGPIPGYRQHLSGEVAGLFVTIGRFFWQQPWAYTSALAASRE